MRTILIGGAVLLIIFVAGFRQRIFFRDQPMREVEPCRVRHFERRKNRQRAWSYLGAKCFVIAPDAEMGRRNGGVGMHRLRLAVGGQGRSEPFEFFARFTKGARGGVVLGIIGADS